MDNNEVNPIIWDEIWKQPNTKKKFKSIEKKLHLYLDISNILSFYLKGIKIKNPNVLELGCGGSPFFSYLQKNLPEGNIIGMDRSLNALYLLKTTHKTSYETNLVCGDIFKNPIRENRFDIVCSFGFIEHFRNPKMVLEVHKKLLKPGGIIVCLIPNLEGLPGSIINFLRAETIIKITKKEFKNWFYELEFKDINIKPVGGLSPSLFLESYSHEKKRTKEKIFYSINSNLINPISILLNALFLFRINTSVFSPFIIGYGKKGG